MKNKENKKIKQLKIDIFQIYYKIHYIKQIILHYK